METVNLIAAAECRGFQVDAVEVIPLVEKAEREKYSVMRERHEIRSFETYELFANEVDEIERIVTSPEPPATTFSVGLLSMALTLAVTIATVPISDLKTYVLFWVGIFVGFILGMYFLLEWLRQTKLKRQASQGFIEKIRARKQHPAEISEI